MKFMWQPHPDSPGEIEEFGAYDTTAAAIAELLSGAPAGVDVTAEPLGDGTTLLVIRGEAEE